MVLDAPVNIKKATFSLSAQAGKVFKVDDLKIRLLGASKKQQSDEPHLFIEIEVIGGSLPADEIDLVDRAGKAVKYHGWGSTGTERQLITLYYPYAQITGKPGGYRLRLKVPEKVIEHVLKVRLKDVLLSPPP